MWQIWFFQPFGWHDCKPKDAAFWLDRGGQVRLV